MEWKREFEKIKKKKIKKFVGFGHYLPPKGSFFFFYSVRPINSNKNKNFNLLNSFQVLLLGLGKKSSVLI